MQVVYMTLQERCSWIRLKMDVNMCQRTLSKIYKSNGVTRLKPDFKFCLGKRTEAEM
jgi:hypothetical protein